MSTAPKPRKRPTSEVIRARIPAEEKANKLPRTISHQQLMDILDQLNERFDQTMRDLAK